MEGEVVAIRGKWLEADLRDAAGDTQVDLVSLDSMLSVNGGDMAAMVEWLEADLRDAAGDTQVHLISLDSMP